MLNPSQLHSTYIWKQPSLTGGTTPSYPCLPTSSRDFCLLWSSLMTTEIFFLKLALWAYNSSKRLFVLFFFIYMMLWVWFLTRRMCIYIFFLDTCDSCPWSVVDGWEELACTHSVSCPLHEPPVLVGTMLFSLPSLCSSASLSVCHNSQTITQYFFSPQIWPLCLIVAPYLWIKFGMHTFPNYNDVMKPCQSAWYRNCLPSQTDLFNL